MAYFTTTELGREVQLEDWIGFHRDRLLSMMVQMRTMSTPYPAFQLSTIERITGLPIPHASNLAQTLTREGLLARDDTSRNVWLITAHGVRWVEESPRSPVAE